MTSGAWRKDARRFLKQYIQDKRNPAFRDVKNASLEERRRLSRSETRRRRLLKKSIHSIMWALVKLFTRKKH